MKIAIAKFGQETSSFSPVPGEIVTRQDHFIPWTDLQSPKCQLHGDGPATAAIHLVIAMQGRKGGGKLLHVGAVVLSPAAIGCQRCQRLAHLVILGGPGRGTGHQKWLATVDCKCC